METPPQGSSQVPPIVTTPPQPGLKDERLSQSSSGTQISNASGVSLGEAIRRRSLMTQDPEAWYRPCAETDASNLVGWRLGQTPGGCNVTEFPTMEEGLLTPTVNFRGPQASGMTHSPVLEMADSQLSPNLPLRTTNATQGQTFFNETVFRHTGLDFAPLRATPDVSTAAVERPSARVQIGEAVQLAAREVGPGSSREASLSQHPLSFSLTAPNNASLGSYLSQHPLTFPEAGPAAEQRNWPTLHADLSAKTLDPEEENSRLTRPPVWPNQPRATQRLPDEDLFLLDNSLPAPLLLDLLEDEMGLPKHGGFFSPGGSSGQSSSGKDPGEHLINQLTVNLDLSESAPKLTLQLRQSKGQTTPPPESPRRFLDPAGKPWRRASDPGALWAYLSPALAPSGAHPFSLVGSSAIPERSPAPNRQQAGGKRQSRAEEDQRKCTAAPVDSKPRASSPFQPLPAGADVSERTDAARATLVSKNELTLSAGSVERAPKNAGISPFDEASFSVHLAHPIHHSTPGVWTTRSLNCEVPGAALPPRSGFQRPLACLHEETAKTSHADARRSSAAEPRGNLRPFPTQEDVTSPGAAGSRRDTRDGFTVLQPLKGRIQSMPSLNFMEKVGAWHLSSSAEKLLEVSAVHGSGPPVPGSGGVSPRRKAYDAIADSLNRILLKQQSLADLKAASFYGPSSLNDLHSSRNEPPPRALPFTRSQSETSVSALSRETSRTDAGHETRPVAHADASPASWIETAAAAALHRRYQAVPVFVTVSSDEESVSPGRPSDPLIKSRRVAELLRGETSSFDGSKEELAGAEEKTRELPDCRLPAGQMRMDYFRDLSPDHFNQGTDSGTDSCTDFRLSSRQSSRSSPALSKLQSSLEDELQSSHHSELNIDERIPVYLHNLGIDQSPSSILTPFMPRGPLREIEFSPTELRTLKASSDLFRLHLSEDSQSARDATRSTFNSSLLSGPALAGSAVVPDTSPPTKPSPHTSDLLQPRSSLWKPHAVTPPLAASAPRSPSAPVSPKETRVIPGSPSTLERSTRRVASPEDHLGPNKRSADRVKSVSPSQDTPASEEIRSSSAIPDGERGDSFAGSNVPREIQKPPAELDSGPPSDKFRSRLSVFSSGSLKQIDRGDLAGDPGSSQRSALGMRRGGSWDECMAKQEITGGLKWEDLQKVDFFGKELTVPRELRPGSQKANPVRRTTKPVARSDPEGCPRTAGNRSLPRGRCPDLPASPSPNLQEIQSLSKTDDVSQLLRGFPRAEEKADETAPKEIGVSQDSANSGSVDSLGIRVKELLRHGHPASHRTPQREEREGSGPKEPSVSAAGSASGRGEVGARGSSNGSSMDSLAVRVQTLLQEEQPVLHATQILQSVEEEEEKARAWVRLKLATEPQYFIPELTEEERRLIERMKREQLPSSGEAEALENQRGGSSFRRLPNSNRAAAVEAESLQKPRDHDLHAALQKYGLQLGELSGENAEPAMGGALAAEPEVQLSRGGQIPVPSQRQPPLGNALDSKANSRHPLEAHLRGATKAPAEEDGDVAAPLVLSESSTSVEAAIQITSITFASRRRSPSPSSRVSRTLLADVPPREPVSSDSRFANQERQKLDSSQLRSYQVRPSAGAAAVRASDKNVASPSPNVSSPSLGSIPAARDGPRREDLVPSLEESPRRGVDPKDLVQQTHAGKQAPDPGLAEQRRYAKTLDNIDAGGFNPERSAALPPPKTGDVRPRNCEAGSAPKPLRPEGEEKTRIRDDLSTSDSFLHKPRSRGRGSPPLSHSASLDCISTAVPASPTSPTRKALSGVHLTLSPKRVELDLSGPVAVGPEGKEGEVLKTATSDVPSPSLEATSKPTESQRRPDASSSFPREGSPREVPKGAKPAPQRAQEPRASRDGAADPWLADARTRSASASAGDHLKATASSQTEWTSSDAITQITTESPEKTTYSAEIFVAAESGEAPYLKGHKTPNDTTLGVARVSVVDGQTGDGLLVLPYKPPGCSEVYYVPCGKQTLRLSRVRSETTVESSHSGSNDAVPPDFPPQVLGSRKDHPSDTAMVKHKEGIYSKKAAPRTVWMEEKTAATTAVDPGGGSSGPRSSESLKASRPGFDPAQSRLKPPLREDAASPPGSEALGQVEVASRAPAPSPQDSPPRKGILGNSPPPSPRLHLPRREERFIPLTGEADESFLRQRKSPRASERDLSDAPQTSFGRASQLPSGSRPVKETRLAEPARGPSARQASALDGLWAKYLERQNRQPRKPVGSDPRPELSLVERLDRLARLLQNPLRHSLALALEDQKAPRRKAPRLGSPRDKKMAARRKGASRASTETSEEALAGPGRSWPRSQSKHLKTGPRKAAEPGGRNWDGRRTSETSETSSEPRPARGSRVATGATSESEGTRLETESATTPTEPSESASTINTARLVRAFGQERVQVSPKLSQLYSTIDLQKTRSETWGKRGKKAKGEGYPKMVHLEQKRKEAQPSPSFTSSSSDSVSSLGSSRGPSPALSSKRMSHKAVQAGDFEIVNSATKRHTRDVGLTFPTPTPSQATLQGGPGSSTEHRPAQHRGLSAEDEEQQTWQPGGYLEGRRLRRSRSEWTQGVSWFVPAAELKPDPLEEDGGGFPPGPAPAWSEPPPRGKPWREPLREQNWPERPGGLQVRLASPARDTENEPPSPLGKMTLQESLAMHRPDFISSSGERLKRLQLLIEERKLQNEFQGERDRLFNPPGGTGYGNTGGLANRGYRVIQSRAISKNEMVERSKRIYEQLPEVRQRREEARRKSEYSTNRLKAQLYKTKITNRVLGRKVPWE